jgi:glutamine amidotransferase
MKIGIINYGVGNSNSIVNMFHRSGNVAKIINSPNEILDFDKLVLPGVGSFDYGMSGLINGGWIKPLNDFSLVHQKPILGICLGMQLMCNNSQEGVLNGLGWVDAEVKKFNFNLSTGIKIPHMGWNTLSIKKENRLFHDTNSQRKFYFVHSYYVDCNIDINILATSQYNIEFTSVFKKNNIYGVQFHPEKSHKYGLELFQNFAKL